MATFGKVFHKTQNARLALDWPRNLLSDESQEILKDAAKGVEKVRFEKQPYLRG